MVNSGKLSEVSNKLNEQKVLLRNLLPEHLRADFMNEVYISGGCIYSLYNDQEPKDYDFFVRSQAFARRLQLFFINTYFTADGKIEFETGKMKIFFHRDNRVVMTKNAISIGKWQIITKFVGEPIEVVGQFDFMHNTYWHDKDKIESWKSWDFLDSDKLIYNEERARDISGTIIRVHRFVERGMKITNAEVSKMLRKLRDVGFTDRENEIIEMTASY